MAALELRSKIKYLPEVNLYMYLSYCHLHYGLLAVKNLSPTGIFSHFLRCYVELFSAVD